MTPQRVSLISLGVGDLDRSRAFYSALGWVPVPSPPTVVFYQFASGLVLYWMVSNVLAIAHQLWVGRRLRTGTGAAKA